MRADQRDRQGSSHGDGDKRASPEPDGHEVEPSPAAAGYSYVDWLAMTEISDDDYRSFCWPCHDLDEPDSGEGTGTERAG